MSEETDWQALLDEQSKWEADGNPAPLGPLWIAIAFVDLDEERQRYEANDYMALLAAIRICAARKLPIPDWAAQAFIRRYDHVLNCRTGSWDEAFGQPYPGKHVPDLRKRRELKYAIPQRIKELRSQDDPPPMNGNRHHEGVYNQVAREFDVGRTYVTELWKEYKNRVLGSPGKI